MDFSNCLRALDGKHIAIECPKNSASMYGAVLMACCDANYFITFDDIGIYGRDNDASIFAQTELAHYFENEKTAYLVLGT